MTMNIKYSLIVSRSLEIPLLRILWLILYLIFKNRIFGLLISSVFRLFIYFDIIPLLDLELMETFSHSVGCHFFFILTEYFTLEKFFSFVRSHVLIVNISVWAVCFLHKK